MQSSICFRCKKEVHPSNLIYGSECFYCYQKTIHNAKLMVKFYEFFAPIYKMTPIFAGIVSLLYFIMEIEPKEGILWLLISDAIILVICFFGMLGSFLPNWTSTMIEERKLELQSHLQTYKSLIASDCELHPGREAIGRCSICFKPLCAEDFIYIGSNPSVCRNCNSKDKIVELNLSAIFPAIISTLLLCIVGIYYNTVNSGDFESDILFATFFLIIIMLSVVILRSKSSLKYKNINTRHRI